MWLRIRKLEEKDIVFGKSSEEINLRNIENGVVIPKGEFYDVYLTREECTDIKIYDSWNPHIKDAPKRTNPRERPKSNLELKIEELETKNIEFETRITELESKIEAKEP